MIKELTDDNINCSVLLSYILASHIFVAIRVWVFLFGARKISSEATDVMICTIKIRFYDAYHVKQTHSKPKVRHCNCMGYKLFLLFIRGLPTRQAYLLSCNLGSRVLWWRLHFFAASHIRILLLFHLTKVTASCNTASMQTWYNWLLGFYLYCHSYINLYCYRKKEHNYWCYYSKFH